MQDTNVNGWRYWEGGNQTHSPWESSSVHFQIHLHPKVGAKEMRRRRKAIGISLFNLGLLTCGPGTPRGLVDGFRGSSSHLKLQF